MPLGKDIKNYLIDVLAQKSLSPEPRAGFGGYATDPQGNPMAQPPLVGNGMAGNAAQQMMLNKLNQQRAAQGQDLLTPQQFAAMQAGQAPPQSTSPGMPVGAPQ